MLESLPRRPRGRPIAPLLAKLSGGRVARDGSDTTEGARILRALREYEPPTYEEELGPPSAALLTRIHDADLAELDRRVEPELRTVWDSATPVVREHLKLILGVHYEVPGILEKTGLRTDMPPDDVHAMGRGPLAAGGDFWLADLVAGAVERSGIELAPGTRVLDFGCSSGRHLRVLQAWRPDVRWLGCDPNATAVHWASEHLPGVELFASPVDPPLELPETSLDAVFAISVWSHFAAAAAERWLDEMHRLIRPGGVLVFTTQSVASLARYLREGDIPPEYAVGHTESLLATGHYYRPAFGPGGDWGVKSAQWGLGYLTLDWLAQRVLPHWELVLYEAARIEATQDLVVLRRASD